MNKLKVLLIVFLISGGVEANVVSNDNLCKKHWNSGNEVFRLEVTRAFRPTIRFVYCDGMADNEYFLGVVTYKKGDKSLTTVDSVAQKNIEKTTNSVVQNLLEKALGYNTLDNLSGSDGSSWCLQNRRGLTFTVGCFFTPMYNAKKRGLEGLSELGDYLWTSADMKQSHGELY